MAVIVTNSVPRPIVCAFELTQKERTKFDYLDWKAIDEGRDSASFVRYKGHLYDLGEFMRCSSFEGWHGAAGDSYFSGVLIRLLSDGESVVLATYFS